MICRVCLSTANDIIEIFDGSTNVAPVLTKHFWFVPKIDDPISTVICINCWTRVKDFHDFYLTVEKAHRLLTERFSVQTVQKESNDFSLLKYEEEEELEIQSADTVESFSNEQFLNDVFADESNHSESESENESVELQSNNQEQQDSKDVPIVVKQDENDEKEPRRTTRSTSIKTQRSASSKLPATSEVPTAGTRRRGRPRKGMEKPVKVYKPKRYTDYKQTMLDIDKKISQHMRLACDICHEGQETFLLLCKHMSQTHRRKGYAICCNKKFYKRSFLTDHIDRHSNPEKFKCHLCGKTFADKQCLRNHELLKHQPDEEKTFKCEHCPKRYTKQYLLDQHGIIHKERNMPCEVCDRRFPNISLLSTHIKMVHGNYGTMCDICAMVIRGQAAFKRHQLEHEGITEPKVQCDICGSWHKNKYSLKKHVRRHNGTSEECTCNICGKVSPNRSAMLSHQRYVHLADRKFECSVCSKAFKKAITLKEHMTMHTGEVLYKCPHCPKTFNSNANKHSHRKKCHPKEFEEARKLRTERRMKNLDQSEILVDENVITIRGTGVNEGETHSILVTTTDEQILDDNHKTDGGGGGGIELTLCLTEK